ncbi:hypothetical protein EOD41_16630 [Mucilaginibacter limnophilus]|uniref:Uncharacterized protein n=1 Tax=Mucilaginibacter limnophilus TaxID=1932778 RepID=A0A3S2V093_9SPHI|nr:hypothetical protein [Mucilaginibacter limnophilus]RVT98418.1 hypothetical protein EOD41_16630 [Mucilaginibacter limnophilus]
MKDFDYIENMGVRRILFLLTTAWLINTMVCFHGSNPFESKQDFTPYTSKQLHAPHSLLLWLMKSQRGFQQQEEKQTEKIKYRYRYIGAQNHFLQIFWKAVEENDNYHHLSFSTVMPGYRLSGKLPTSLAAYILLFRLTPF